MNSYELGIDVNAPVSACYWMWRDFKAFPAFMDNVLEVKHKRANIWCWQLVGEKGDESAWELILDKDIPESLISWKTLSGPEIEMFIDVNFQPLGEERTRIRISLVSFYPDFGVGKVLESLYGVSESQVQQNLASFKERAERLAWADGDAHLAEPLLPSRNAQRRKKPLRYFS